VTQQQILELCITKAGGVRALARLTGKQPKQVSDWRMGRVTISYHNLMWLCDVVGVEVKVK
jgi:transcriptional regulator with XRE-family HTH domain